MPFSPSSRLSQISKVDLYVGQFVSLFLLAILQINLFGDAKWQDKVLAHNL